MFLSFSNDNNKILADLIKEVKANEVCKAICQISGGAHGYIINYQILQLQTGELLIRNWGDFGDSGFEIFKRQGLKLDLVEELHKLRKENPKLRTTIDSERRSRFGTIYIATAKDGDWITCRPPGNNGVYENTVVDRLYSIIFRGV